MIEELTAAAGSILQPENAIMLLMRDGGLEVLHNREPG